MKTATRSRGTLSADKRNSLDEGAFAFPEARKEPLNNASHVRNAIGRFDQVKDVSASEKAGAFKRIKAAAKKFGVDMTATSAASPGQGAPAKKQARKAAKKAAKKVAAKKAPAKSATK